MKALLEIFMNGGIRYDPGTELVVLSPVEEILRAGQKAGEFRDFDAQVMAAVIQRAIDGLPFLLETHPGIELGTYATELVTTWVHVPQPARPQARDVRRFAPAARRPAHLRCRHPGVGPACRPDMGRDVGAAAAIPADLAGMHGHLVPQWW